MFVIRRDGKLVHEVKIDDEGAWDRTYRPVLLTFKTEKMAHEVANLWEGSTVEPLGDQKVKARKPYKSKVLKKAAKISL